MSGLIGEVTADKDSKDPKVLVKADVLEWEKISGNEISGIQAEINRARGEVAQYSALTEYETAVGIKTTADKDSKDPKVLVKADVLEWERISGSEVSGIQAEINRARGEVAQYFAFCSCLSGLLQYGKEEVTRVVRS